MNLKDLLDLLETLSEEEFVVTDLAQAAIISGLDGPYAVYQDDDLTVIDYFS